jgi:membrane-associated protease RseP (regulator of RpoE activity)
MRWRARCKKRELDSMTPAQSRWRLPLLLIFSTFLSTSFVGALREDPHFFETWNLAAGISFSFPLMAILLAHEFGHYLAAKRHGVLTSPPYFIPFPFFLLGTMGAVIAMRERVKDRTFSRPCHRPTRFDLRHY